MVGSTAATLSGYPKVHESPESLKELAREHWAKYRPKMYQRLKKSGVLEELLNRAVDFTREDMRQLEKELKQQGYDEARAREKAWHTLGDKWILLPSEK